MILHLVLNPYMPTDLVLYMTTFLLPLSWIHTWYAPRFDSLHAISPLFCYCRGSIHNIPIDLILYMPFCLLSCYYQGSVHRLATICLLFWSCSYYDNCIVLFTINILLIWVLKVLVVYSDLKSLSQVIFLVWVCTQHVLILPLCSDLDSYLYGCIWPWFIAWILISHVYMHAGMPIPFVTTDYMHEVCTPLWLYTSTNLAN